MHYNALLKRIHEIQDLRKATRVLTWDREVVMPKGGDSDRIKQIATLRRLSHQLYISDEMGELIESAAAELNGAGYLSTEASLVRFLRRDYLRACRLPTDFVTRLTTLNSQATAAWKQARQDNNFPQFKPWLEQVVVLNQEMADLLGYDEEPYDALLDTYEPGAKTSDVRNIFDDAKENLIPLYRAIGRRRSTANDAFLRQYFDPKVQNHFAHYIAEAIGYDFNRGHLATAVHPFSTSLSRNDVRITTRYDANSLVPGIFATLHEAGHAMYVQNVDPNLTRTPLAKETSAGLDESQSRLVENIIGRSRGFWRVHLPTLRKHFPGQLNSVTLESFYHGINKIQPGFIRVEADELTYNMHIILRFEMEQELLSGDLKVADLPERWNQKMKHYLGIIPPNNRQGCLQDIHWTMVGFGYFPTYALGNLYAAQLYEAAINQEPQIIDELEVGNTVSLLLWLRENVHQFGRKLTPPEIMMKATGKKLESDPFIRYMKNKYTEIYDLTTM